LATALVHPLVEASAAGRLRMSDPDAVVSDALRDAIAPVAEAVLPDAPTIVVLRALESWAALIGSISLELFGHWANTVLDPEAFFDETVRGMARSLGLM
jgi:hypothetical protein